ncbi:MAG: thiamine pyrophosphate-binding protein [Rhodospirillaceae bacterium]|nr:thiamine pyrophosphate-binding protein [Rhodospirillaceae bacterium]
MSPKSRAGGQVLIDALLLHAVDTVFCVPGESFLGALDAMHDHRDRLKVFTARHEAGAVNMAEAHGKLTGRPGVAFVTRGPGAMHGAVGVHTAMQDETPLVLFVGQVKRTHLGREAFQEMDFVKVFSSFAKWAVQITDPATIPDTMAEAFACALSGRRGPVVIALPEDVQTETVTVDDSLPEPIAHAAPTEAQMAQLRELLLAAHRPLMVVGGSGWSEKARADITHFAEIFDLAVATSWRRKDRFDNAHRCYVGDMGLAVDPNLARRVKEADVILAVNARLDDNTTSGYTLPAAPQPAQRLIHVYPDAAELGRVYKPTLGIEADIAPFAAAAAALKGPDSILPWAEWRAEARADYETFIAPRPCPGTVDLARIFSELPDHLPADAIVTNGAGTYTTWHHRYFLHRKLGTYLGPTSGAMGYGVPAAIAAKAAYPKRTVVALAGDGCFSMAAMELATAQQYRLPIVVLVMNNGILGSIRMHQERHYPGRVMATGLVNPDFAALARSFGGHGETVRTTAEFWPALKRGLAADMVSVIDIHVDPEAIMPHTTLSGLGKRG